ncbi:hypothetical protein BGZ58_011041 [Dissophora ornata]|nr:hypothetical protein BGZ58_011041 [Dissophora ornata]
MLRFVSGKFKPMNQYFNVWDHTLPEIYGIILGMFNKLGLVDCLNITESELLDFIIDVDRGYLATFYHSFYHAADVTVMLYHMLAEMNASQFLSKPDMTAVLLAGLCHDIGHPGLNNLFQVNAKTELVKQFGEASVLERYSCSLAMDLVAKHKLFRNIEKSEAATLPEGNRATAESMKESMIKAIMATDMSFHYNMLNNLNTLTEFISTPSSSVSNSDSEATETESDTDADCIPPSPTRPHCSNNHNHNPNHSHHNHNHNHSHHDANCDSPSSSTENVRAMTSRFECHSRHHHHRRQSSSSSISSNSSVASMRSDGSTQTTQSIMEGMSSPRSPSDLTPELRQSFLNCLLHGADISNPVKPWELCKRWSDLVMKEFYRQGDIEKAQNLPVSPNMDRDLHSQAQISLGFVDFVVQPYFESLAELLPESSPFLESLAYNHERWKLQKLEQDLEKERLQSADGAAATAAAAEVILNTTTDAVDALGQKVTGTGGIQRAGSPLPLHIIAVRRVSVAAGVLVLDDTRPQRPHHRRFRHSTNTDSSGSHHHAIRKIKRSLSGRALSSYLRDLHVHPRPLQASINKTADAARQDAVVALKREAALVGKDSNVNLADKNGSPNTDANAEANCGQEASAEDKVLGLAPKPAQQPRLSQSDLAYFRQRRHGSLQLEEKHSSIRQEYGDGYVILNHQDHYPFVPVGGGSDVACIIPTDPLYASNTLTAASATWNGPSPSPSQSLPFTPGVGTRSGSTTGSSERSASTTPVSQLPSGTRYRASSRSSTPAVLIGGIHYDWLTQQKRVSRSGCGPLDDSADFVGSDAGGSSSISTAAATTSNISSNTMMNDPPSPAMDASEGQTPLRKASLSSSPLFKKEIVSAVAVPVMTSLGSEDDGPLGCVVGTSARTKDGDGLTDAFGERLRLKRRKPSLLEGTVSIAAASAGSSSTI